MCVCVYAPYSLLFETRAAISNNLGTYMTYNMGKITVG